MKIMLRKNLLLILLLVAGVKCFCQDSIYSLLKKAQESGMNVYWDSLTVTGIIEKNGHQLSFKPGENIAMLDSSEIAYVDAPVLKNGEVFVSEDFIDIANEMLKNQESEGMFKIGVILIDPGHGGKDPGAIGNFNINGKPLKVQEKDAVLSVALMLSEKLKKAYPQKRIIMTRNNDTFLSLSERTNIANGVKLNDNEAVLYVSVHANASLDKKASGYETWYLSPGYRRTVLDKSVAQDDKSLFPILNSMMEEEYTAESILMSKFIMDGLQTQIGNESKARGIKAEEWFVVKNANMPSVLVEIGFVTNEKEAVNLSNPEYLKKTSTGIYNGIQAFVTHFERSRGFTSANNGKQ